MNSEPWARARVATLVALAALLALPAVAGAEIVGTVSGGAGRAVEQARVTVAGGDATTRTDARGGFTLPGVEPPVELRVSHPRYQDATVEVAGDGPVEIVLQPKQEVFETLVVSAARSPDDEATPPTLAASAIDPQDLPVPPPTLTETVRTVPGVAENGQGGLFQVFSIRGIARQRILTLVSGMRITSERRAGVATSFLDPKLMGEVDVVRGPASTWYGSGALGGVVEIFPRRFDTLRAEAGYHSAGDERFASVGWGDGEWSLAAAHRRAGDTESPDGQRLFSRYERTMASLSRTWGSEERLWELTLLPSLTTDIGKPNTDFPEETTIYPREEHLLARLAVTEADGSRASVWMHPQALDTESVEPGVVATVENDTFDLGANAQRELTLSPTLTGRAGLDYFGRRSVDAFERQRDPSGDLLAVSRTLDGGEQDEAAAYGSLRWTAPGVTLSGGARFTWQRQDNAGAEATDDTAWNGFVGAVVPLPSGFQLTANVGTGLRFPTLSERFFTGTTGRGEIVANPDLDPERSLSTDLGLAWFGDRLFVRGHLFRNEIDDYIERIELAPDVRTFVNLTSGTLEGVEVEASWQPAAGWTVSAGAHRIDGESDAGDRLADVPPDRERLTLAAAPGAGLLGGRLAFQVEAERRAAIRDPGSGEKPIPEAFLLAASLRYALSSELDLVLRGTNLSDELYLPSADDKAVPAPGRAYGLSLAWAR